MPNEKETVTVAGAPVRWTPREGRPLLLLTRMASGDTGIWDRIWPLLEAHFTVACPGLSLPAPDVLDTPERVFSGLARQCRDIAEALGFARFHLLGWIGGTHVALRCAADFREAVASCTLVGPFHTMPDTRLTEKFLEFRRVMFAQPDRELYCYYWYLSQLTPDYVDRNFDEIERLAAARAERDKFLTHDTDRIMKWDRALQRHWLTDGEFAGITAPAFIAGLGRNVWNDGPSAAMARAVHAKMPTSTLVVLERARSLVLWEDPEAFMSVAEPFFLEVTRSGAGSNN